jgi:ribosomal protein L31
VANESEANVIYLQSHPVWTAAHRRERQLQEAMRRHPAYIARQRAAAVGGSVSTGHGALGMYSTADAPA